MKPFYIILVCFVLAAALAVAAIYAWIPPNGIRFIGIILGTVCVTALFSLWLSYRQPEDLPSPLDRLIEEVEADQPMTTMTDIAIKVGQGRDGTELSSAGLVQK